MDLPTGTVTFLFTDIEGSTRLLRELGDRYPDLLAAHHRLLRDAWERWGGRVLGTEGDAFFVVFPRARDALQAAVVAQRAVREHSWPAGAAVHVRMGLHTGEPLVTETGYVGIDVHRAARIAGAAWGGQILVSNITQALLSDDLPEGMALRDLGPHRLKDLAHPERLFLVLASGLPADFPPLRSLDNLPNNLPLQLTSFVGRERELAEVRSLLTTSRLVTFTGSGGAGKTRLALQVAAEILAEFPDGTWFVELGNLADDSLLAQTVATAVGAREEPTRPIAETLPAYLQTKHLLLILDNCEHLVAACAALVDRVLRTCPRIRLLATSREGLGVPGEVTYPVPSLSLPDGERSPDDLLAYESVRLFFERALLSRPDFRLTPQNAGAVAQIARRLDGIPLAIELAAARVRALSVEQIAERLDDRFRLLSGGVRTALPRHRTLQAALDWGYNLLGEEERSVLRRVGIFIGGFSLEAAEAVCAGDGIAGGDVLQLLSQLVEKSLVVLEEQTGRGRYRLLETIRQYALDRLLETGESEQLRTRHRDFFLQWAEAQRQTLQAVGGVFRGRQAVFGEFEAEHDNLRTALQWSWARGEALTALRLATAVAAFWNQRAHWTEGRHWLEQTLAASDPPLPLRARALYDAGALAWFGGDSKQATVRIESSLALFRDLGEARGIAAALDFLAVLAYRGGDYHRAATLLEESLGLLRPSGDREETAFALYLLGILARLRGEYDRAEALGHESLVINRELGLGGREPLTLDSLGLVARSRADLARAEELCAEALAIFEATGDKFGIIGSLNSLALIAADRRDLDRAEELADRCLTMARELGQRAATARALNVLGRVAHYRGDAPRAFTLHREGLALFHDLGEPLGIAQSLERLAVVAEPAGQDDRAARLFGAAAALGERIGSYLPPIDRGEYDPVLDRLQSRLGAEQFRSAWVAGQGLAIDEAVRYALGT